MKKNPKINSKSTVTDTPTEKCVNLPAVKVISKFKDTKLSNKTETLIESVRAHCHTKIWSSSRIYKAYYHKQSQNPKPINIKAISLYFVFKLKLKSKLDLPLFTGRVWGWFLLEDFALKLPTNRCFQQFTLISLLFYVNLLRKREREGERVEMMLSQDACLDGQPEDTDDAVHGLVFPSHCAASVSLIIPVTGASCVQTSPIFLHDDTGHNVFEGFAELGELVEALFHNTGRPLVDLVVLIGVTSNSPLHCLLDDVGHFIHDKCRLFSRLEIIHFQRLADF